MVGIPDFYHGIGLGICGFINLFWKVSFHTFASSAMATMFFMVTNSWWSLALLLLVSLVIAGQESG